MEFTRMCHSCMKKRPIRGGQVRPKFMCADCVDKRNANKENTTCELRAERV